MHKRFFIILMFTLTIGPTLAAERNWAKKYQFRNNWFGQEKSSLWKKHLKDLTKRKKLNYLEVGVQVLEGKCGRRVANRILAPFFR